MPSAVSACTLAFFHLLGTFLKKSATASLGSLALAALASFGSPTQDAERFMACGEGARGLCVLVFSQFPASFWKPHASGRQANGGESSFGLFLGIFFGLLSPFFLPALFLAPPPLLPPPPFGPRTTRTPPSSAGRSIVHAENTDIALTPTTPTTTRSTYALSRCLTEMASLHGGRRV